MNFRLQGCSVLYHWQQANIEKQRDALRFCPSLTVLTNIYLIPIHLHFDKHTVSFLYHWNRKKINQIVWDVWGEDGTAECLHCTGQGLGARKGTWLHAWVLHAMAPCWCAVAHLCSSITSDAICWVVFSAICICSDFNFFSSSSKGCFSAPDWLCSFTAVPSHRDHF